MIIKADETLDTFGLLCPMPIVKTALKVKEMQVGQTLEVLASDDGIKEDMPAWCRSTGNEYLGIEEQNGEYRVYIRKLK
ncbi:sulfurtransferase TusA family protein [Candidatus Saganbacteria bacterium]|nr:sulfurtransferase TusA family protein [Candidatus Saganbacteria bacterium]